ncbi:hypothetical protein AAZX31_16G181400 [Glycine max]
MIRPTMESGYPCQGVSWSKESEAWKKVETRSVASKKRKRVRPVGMRRYMIWLRGLLKYAASMFHGIIGTI